MSKAITIAEGGAYHPLRVRTLPEPSPKPDEVLIQFTTAALNHRDLFIRQNLYPSPSFENPMLADGCGVILPHKDGASPPTPKPGQRVLVNPGTGWARDPIGPDGPFAVIGGVKPTKLGTLQERAAFPAEDVVPAPEHLSDAEAAALPLAGLTAWRALVTKAGPTLRDAGSNVLVTGIGGGVALMALQFAAARGFRVWVSSSSEEKIKRAVKLGAAGAVLYTDKEWPKRLAEKLPKERPYLDTVIDGAGGDIIGATWKLLKEGGVVVVYGMTSRGFPELPMAAVLKNIELKGSTMGSREEFKAMIDFVKERKIRPVVDKVVETDLDDLAAIDGLFDDMQHGKQFGKLVVRIKSGDQAGSKL